MVLPIGTLVTGNPIVPNTGRILMSEALRVKSGPNKIPGRNVWEVEVAIPAYSSKLAWREYRKLPVEAEFDGKTYHKVGMRASDCTAWYRRAGEQPAAEGEQPAPSWLVAGENRKVGL